MTERKCFVFSSADVEVREREFLLIKGGERLSIEPKAFRVLLFLLRNPGRLVSKDEIVASVWNDTVVSDNSLTRSVAQLRRVLDDDPREPQVHPDRPHRRVSPSLRGPRAGGWLRRRDGSPRQQRQKVETDLSSAAKPEPKPIHRRPRKMSSPAVKNSGRGSSSWRASPQHYSC